MESVAAWNWKKNPLRFDPQRGYMLCESCWNGNHWQPSYKDLMGVNHPKVSNCMLSRFKGLGECGCGCTDPGPKRVKFVSQKESLF